MKRTPALLLALCALALPLRAAVIDPGAFAYRASFTVSGYAGSAPLENFPVLVRLSATSPSGFDYAACAADGSDLRFSDADGNVIPHEIEAWDTAGESLVWVKLPEMDAGTTFSMWYGGAAAAADATGTWSAYTGVWHMDEASGSVADATGHGLTASPQGNTANSAAQAMKDTYANGVTDEFMIPTVILKNGAPTAKIAANDSVIFFNFRPDRAREITRAFCCEDFESYGFARRNGFFPVKYVCFSEYDVTIPNKTIAFKKVEVTNTFGEWLASKGLRQARIAETEKYAHVTFFFNGGVEAPNAGEDRILVDSPKYVPTYDKKPRMSAYTVCDRLSEAITKKDEDGSAYYDVIICNFANPDMVGHTGVLAAATEAIEVIDKCLGEIEGFIKEVGGVMFVCADHGNAEQLVDYETGAPFTAHTTNPVPFILVNAEPGTKLREGGCLADIIPTLIQLMGMEQPKEMTGKSLILA